MELFNYFREKLGIISLSENKKHYVRDIKYTGALAVTLLLAFSSLYISYGLGHPIIARIIVFCAMIIGIGFVVLYDIPEIK